MRSILFFSFCVSLTLSTLPAEEFVFRHSNVLGTHLELRLISESEEMARQAEKKALEEIDRLDLILSSYRSDSELQRWLSSRALQSLSPDLRQLLIASEEWNKRSQGAFHPGVERLTRLWKKAEGEHRLPTEAELHEATAALSSIGWVWDSDRRKAQSSGLPLSFNANGKGYIIDRVCDLLDQMERIQGGLVAIGGDLRAFGEMKRTVRIQSPVDDLTSHPIGMVRLTNASMATSSGAFRGVEIEGIRYSHLMDPRTGKPVSHVRSVSVIAPMVADADALSTICSVLSIEESMALIEASPSTACLIVDADGNTTLSSRWREYQVGKEQWISTEVPSDWNGGMELKVDFTIHEPGGGNRYRRPYVAVWVEDKDGFPVKTLVLWVQSTGPGPRWIPDLKKWYKSDRLRKLADETDLVQTVSEATRKPGSYSVIWNGDDDHKKLVGPGEYTLYIEAAREHGTYQLIKKKLELSDKSIKEKLEENVEIKAASIDYRKKEKTK